MGIGCVCLWSVWNGFIAGIHTIRLRPLHFPKQQSNLVDIPQLLPSYAITFVQNTRIFANRNICCNSKLISLVHRIVLLWKYFWFSTEVSINFAHSKWNEHLFVLLSNEPVCDAVKLIHSPENFPKCDSCFVVSLYISFSEPNFSNAVVGARFLWLN